MLQRIVLTVLSGVGFSVVGVCSAAYMQPETTHVERTVTMAAAPADVFVQVNSFDRWVEWNPWKDLDPNQVVTMSEIREGKGAWYEWKGNDDVGHGRMTILESVPPVKVVEELHFLAPFESLAKSTITCTEQGDQTAVTWAFDAKNDFMAKLAGLFMDMDAMLGADFQKGLEQLKPIAEAAAEKRRADEKSAAVAAALEALAAAAPLSELGDPPSPAAVTVTPAAP